LKELEMENIRLRKEKAELERMASAPVKEVIKET